MIRQPNGAPSLAQAGFTLIEIMVALTILGTAALVLLDTHYGALRLFNDTRDDLLMQQFTQSALGQAETEVLGGAANGKGTFGKQYPEYSFTYTAQPMGQGSSIPLYTVSVTVTGPGESKTLTFLVYHLGQ